MATNLMKAVKPSSSLIVWRSLAAVVVQRRTLCELRYKGGQAYGDNQYWESAEDLDKIRRRAEIRLRLKQQWNRIRYNPYNHINRIAYDDVSVTRFAAARVWEEHIVPSWKMGWWYMATNVLPFFIAWVIFEEHSRTKEANIRQGLLPYGDRMFKML